MLNRDVVIIHGNALPRTAATMQNLITTFVWEQFDHPPYSSDLASSDFYFFLHLKTFTTKINHGRFNNSCLSLPASTLVDLIFQLRSFSLGGKLVQQSVHLADVIFIPFIVYYAYVAI
jgi:hypothetical protein